MTSNLILPVEAIAFGTDSSKGLGAAPADFRNGESTKSISELGRGKNGAFH